MTAVEPRSTTRRQRRTLAPETVAPRERFPRRFVFLSLFGAALIWAAFPPLGWSLLAWIATAPWLLLVRDSHLDAKRPYLWLWVVGFAHWLAVLQGIRLAHWATYFGWIALAAYLAFYLPVFVALARAAVHRLHIPLMVAAPGVWVGLEYARGYVATGFSMALLGHTQFRSPTVIQVSDLFGAYTVSFVLVFVAACLVTCFPAGVKPWRSVQGLRWWPFIPLTAILTATFVYGYIRKSQPSDDTSRPPLKAALVQAWVDTIFEYNPERDVETFSIYADLSHRAITEHSELDLIVWPEWVFTDVRPLVTRDATIGPPPGVEWPENITDYIDDASNRFNAKATALAERLQRKPALVVGVSVHHYGPKGVRQYNSAVHLSPSGEVVGRYDKMHPVMFGEYVPLGDYFPWLYQLTPLGGGLSRGQQAESFEIAGYHLAPSVCFESTVPHLIRRHIVQLEQQGQKPDVLVNHTNDGWFWGSSIIDLHLACGVFRAVEHRTPMLIAANTGLSAWIDGNGQIRAEGPRFERAILTAQVQRDPRNSWYTRWGDWAPALCLGLCGVAALSIVAQRVKSPSAERENAVHSE